VSASLSLSLKEGWRCVRASVSLALALSLSVALTVTVFVSLHLLLLNPAPPPPVLLIFLQMLPPMPSLVPRGPVIPLLLVLVLVQLRLLLLLYEDATRSNKTLIGSIYIGGGGGAERVASSCDTEGVTSSCDTKEDSHEDATRSNKALIGSIKARGLMYQELKASYTSTLRPHTLGHALIRL
jgi:hypothetical protein